MVRKDRAGSKSPTTPLLGSPGKARPTSPATPRLSVGGAPKTRERKASKKSDGKPRTDFRLELEEVDQSARRGSTSQVPSPKSDRSVTVSPRMEGDPPVHEESKVADPPVHEESNVAEKESMHDSAGDDKAISKQDAPEELTPKAEKLQTPGFPESTFDDDVTQKQETPKVEPAEQETPKVEPDSPDSGTGTPVSGQTSPAGTPKKPQAADVSSVPGVSTGLSVTKVEDPAPLVIPDFKFQNSGAKAQGSMTRGFANARRNMWKGQRTEGLVGVPVQDRKGSVFGMFEHGPSYFQQRASAVTTPGASPEPSPTRGMRAGGFGDEEVLFDNGADSVLGDDLVIDKEALSKMKPPTEISHELIAGADYAATAPLAPLVKPGPWSGCDNPFLGRREKGARGTCFPESIWEGGSNMPDGPHRYNWALTQACRGSEAARGLPFDYEAFKHALEDGYMLRTFAEELTDTYPAYQKVRDYKVPVGSDGYVPNWMDSEGRTAVHGLAYETRDVESAKKALIHLSKLGWLLNVRDGTAGLTPMELADEYGSRNLARWFRVEGHKWCRSCPDPSKSNY